MKTMGWGGCVLVRGLAFTVGLTGLFLSHAQVQAADANWGKADTEASTGPAEAASTPERARLFARMQESARKLDGYLVNFVCREQIRRFKGRQRSAGREIDVITAQVAYNQDSEHYSDIQQNSRPVAHIRGLPGAWSEGEYGTLLHETVKVLESRPVSFISATSLDGVPAAVFAFEYTADDSPWDILVEGRHYTLPFKGQIWVSPATGDILRIDRIAETAPRVTGIATVAWSVSFGLATVDNKPFWLPVKALYSVTYLDSNRHEWNLIAFSGYQRYGSEVSVRFE